MNNKLILKKNSLLNYSKNKIQPLTRRNVPWWTPESGSCSERGDFETHAWLRTSSHWARWELWCLRVTEEISLSPVKSLHRLKQENVETHTWFPLEQVLGLNGCDVWHGGEDMSTVSGRPLQTVAMVDLSVACFLVQVELEETHMCYIIYSSLFISLQPFVINPYARTSAILL